MSNRLPVEINPIRLVESRQRLEGSIGVDKLLRLSKMLIALKERKKSSTEFQVALDFRLSEMKRPTISGTISGVLEFECQRCLEPVSQVIDSHFSTILVDTDVEAEQLQDGFDTWILENDRIFLADFIEDEVLLSLPPILVHKECDATLVFDNEWAEGPELPANSIGSNKFEEQQEEEKANPFAVLKQLKNQN